MTRYIERFAGEVRFISADFNADLADGQTITDVTWTPAAGMTLVVGSSAVSQDGKSVSGKFNTPTAGEYRLDITLTTTGTVETIKDYVIVHVEAFA